MAGICEGRVAVVTGAGRGLGRAHALEFARQGAKVVVNDLGVGPDGRDGTDAPAQEVVAEIARPAARRSPTTTTSPPGTGRRGLVRTALDTFGRLDVLVNNAGFLRDRMLVNLSEQDWDDVVRVHLKGHFLTLRHAGAHWRDQYKSGNLIDARVINTSSGAGLLGSVGQGNYAAAKAGIAALTIQCRRRTRPLRRHRQRDRPGGPHPHDRGTVRAMMAAPDSGFDAMAPENVSPLVVWLGSRRSRRGHRPGLRGRGRPDRRRRRLAARPDRGARRTLAGNGSRAGGAGPAGQGRTARARLRQLSRRRRHRPVHVGEAVALGEVGGRLDAAGPVEPGRIRG